MNGPGTLALRYRAVVAYTGLILAIVGGYMLLPVVLLPVAGAPVQWYLSFIVPALAMLLGGRLLYRRARPPSAVILRVPEGGVVVVASWLLVCLLSTVPFLVIERLNFTQAVFETVSGWTTTGLSVVDVTRAPPVILVWRALMQWAGGAGLAIIMLAAIAGPPGVGLAAAEGRSDQLVPQVRESVRLVMVLYFVYAAAGTVALAQVGMSWLDAFCHALAAVSTGGFGTRPDSIAPWDEPAVELVLIVLMLAGNLNFVTAWLILRGKLRALWHNAELRLLAVVVVAGVALCFLHYTAGAYGGAAKGLRVALFETVTAATTTGFSTVGYGDWPPALVLWLILLMVMGGGAGSTAGGLKQIRSWMVLHCAGRELMRLLRPRGAVRELQVWSGERPRFLAEGDLQQVTSFALLYLVTLAGGTMILAAHGYELRDSLFEFASALGTVGLSIGVTLPTAPPLVLWTEIAGMLLGRLEFLTIFAAIGRVARDLPLLARLARAHRAVAASADPPSPDGNKTANSPLVDEPVGG